MSTSSTGTWAVIDVGEDWVRREKDEPLGSKEKDWFIEPESDQTQWLLKFARTSGDGVVSGEDWAEVATSSLAGLIGVPAATVRLAVRDGRRSTISRSVVPPDAQPLSHGNEVMSEHDSSYVGAISDENPHYTVRAVHAALRARALQAPEGWRGPTDMDAFDVWTGYVVLDAWVSGGDRHDQNWGLVTEGSDPGSVRRLAPSFDHGNALGFQLRTGRHASMAEDAAALRSWAERGRNKYMAGQPSLVDVATEALSLSSPVARRFWKRKLAAVAGSDVEATFAGAPESVLSVPTSRFCCQLLELNRRRLLDE